MRHCEDCRLLPRLSAGVKAERDRRLRGRGSRRRRVPLRAPELVEGEALARFPVVANDCWCGLFEQRFE